jgi:hypothetical protein
MGDWSVSLRDADRQGSLLSHQSQIDHEEHYEGILCLTQCDFTFPADMSLSAKLFIAKALQKNPD